jgi:CheY-like chemotaxis protein
MSARVLALLEHPEPMKDIADTLEHFGHKVLQVNNFADAMETLRQRDVDLIIGDVHLQNGGSIFDFMRWVKGDPHMHLIPFVCFSSEPPELSKYLSDGVRTAARALGAARYITMEKFIPSLFRAEIEWLLPTDRAGNYYSDSATGNGNHDGHDGHDGHGGHDGHDGHKASPGHQTEIL